MSLVWVLALLVALVTSRSSGPPRTSAEASASERARLAGAVPGPPDRVALIREEHLLNIQLTTHEGRVVRFYDDLVKGKIVAINFMFSACRQGCSVATEHLLEAQQALAERMRREVTFLSISLEPEQDTPDVLRGYAQAHGTGPGWYFLTGKRKDIELLRRKLGAYDLDPVVDADPTQHSGIVILGNEPKGRWKAISALSKPVRIRQAIERTILPPDEWPSGAAVVAEAPYSENEAVEPVDLSRIPSPRSTEH